MTLYSLGEARPRVAPDAWVAPDANVIGQVQVGAAVSIWFGVTIRGDNEWITLGQGSNIQENCVLHTDVGFPLSIGENCTIGHKAMLHGCTIGAQSLIGMGAIVLNGAVIGKSCLIGAGALIPEGKVIPDGSLVIGVPGKVVRMLDETQIAGLLASARHYQAVARRFAADLAMV